MGICRCRLCKEKYDCKTGVFYDRDKTIDNELKTIVYFFCSEICLNKFLDIIQWHEQYNNIDKLKRLQEVLIYYKTEQEFHTNLIIFIEKEIKRLKEMNIK